MNQAVVTSKRLHTALPPRVQGISRSAAYLVIKIITMLLKWYNIGEGMQIHLYKAFPIW